MKKLMTVAALLALAPLGWAGSSAETTDRLELAGKVLQEIMGTPDKGIPEEVM